MTLLPHEPTVQELLDTHALQQLAWTYCHAVDRGDLVLLRSLYHDDAIDDHGAMFCGSPDEYVAWLPRMLASVDVIRHEITNMLFVIDGNRAEGQLVNNAYHLVKGTEVVLGGRYLDVYEKRDGVWRILRRSLVLDMVSDEGFIGSGVSRGVIGPSDPVFDRLPEFRTEPGSPGTPAT